MHTDLAPANLQFGLAVKGPLRRIISLQEVIVRTGKLEVTSGRCLRRPYTRQHVVCNTMNFCKFLVKYQ